MKNLYKIALLLFSVSISAQDLQNANWALSDFGGLHFTTSGRTIISSNLPTNGFASASVSDQQGNLLFYTDGNTVWDATNTIMPNGTGLISSGADFSQNIVIVPNPLDIDKYYIITVAVNEFPGQQYGLLSTEVDINTGVSNKNIPLKDELGNPINSSYADNFGKITTARHSNGLDYWLIAELENRILSFLVDDQGIQHGLVAAASPLPPAFYIGVQGNPNSSNGPMRISPDNDKILIGYSGASDGTNHTNNAIGKLYEAFFDSTTGLISSPVELTNPFGTNPDIYLTGAEFAPNNVTVHRYYEAFGISGTVASTIVAGVKDPVWQPESDIRTYDIPFARNLQRAIDDKIYFDNSDYSATHPDFMGFINSPDVPDAIVDYDVQFNVIDCGTSTSVSTKHIPTWVQWQPCRRFLTTANSITTAVNQEREVWIHATNKINNVSTNKVIYHAGNHLELNPGFETQGNSKFVAYVENCSGNFVFKNGNSQNADNPIGKPNLSREFKISPNPSNSFIDLTINNDTFNKIIIASIDGKIVLDKTVDPTSSYNLDISRYASGIYIVNIISNEGKQYSQKLIKN